MHRCGFALTVSLAFIACGRLNFAPLDSDAAVVDEDAEAPAIDAGDIEFDASVAPRFLYYVEGTAIMRHDIDTTATTTLLSLSAPEELAIDPVARELFITDNMDGAVYVASLDTGDASIFATGLSRPEGIQFDQARQQVYFTDKDSGTINRVGEGEAVTIILGNLQDPDGLSYYAATDTLFYSDRLDGVIGRLSPDGSNQSTLLTGLNGPEGLTIHDEIGKMYWLEVGRIRSANLDGSGIVDVVPSGVVSGEGVSVDKVRGQIYWSDEGSRTIGRADLDGSNAAVLVNASAKLEGLVAGP